MKRKTPSLKHFDAKRRRDVIDIRLANPALFAGNYGTQFWEELVEFVDNQRPRKLLVNFSRVGYCPTDLITALLIAQERLRSEGGLVKLYGLNDGVRKTFGRLNLDRTAFDIYATEAAALAAS